MARNADEAAAVHGCAGDSMPGLRTFYEILGNSSAVLDFVDAVPCAANSTYVSRAPDISIVRAPCRRLLERLASFCSPEQAAAFRAAVANTEAVSRFYDACLFLLVQNNQSKKSIEAMQMLVRTRLPLRLSRECSGSGVRHVAFSLLQSNPVARGLLGRALAAIPAAERPLMFSALVRDFGALTTQLVR
jgi:hypothetical protein